MNGIVNPSEKYFKDGLWGFDGSVWKPLGFVWSYRDIYHESVLETNAAAGANYLYGSIVPADEVWIVQTFTAWNATTAGATVFLGLHTGAAFIGLQYSGYVALTRYRELVGIFCIKAGERVAALHNGCVAGDDINLAVTGYKMSVAG